MIHFFSLLLAAIHSLCRKIYPYKSLRYLILQEYIYSGCNFASVVEAIHLKNPLNRCQRVGLLPARSKIYCFTVIVADLRTWLLDVIARVWLKSKTVCVCVGGEFATNYVKVFLHLIRSIMCVSWHNAVSLNLHLIVLSRWATNELTGEWENRKRGDGALVARYRWITISHVPFSHKQL